MVSEKQIRSVACDFLQAVAEAVRAQLGEYPEREQRSTWLVRASPTSMQSQWFQRRVFNIRAVSLMYQTTMREHFSQQEQLKAVLTDAGIRPETIVYGFLLPLVHHWLEQPEPLALEGPAFSGLMDQFTDAVINKRVVSRLRTAIEGLTLASDHLRLEEGVSIRPIREEELWEFGDVDSFFPFTWRSSMPSEEWKIVDIEAKTALGQDPNLWSTHEAIVVALILLSSGRFEITALGQDVNYGTIGRTMPGEWASGSKKVGWGGYYRLNEEQIRCLTQSWPLLKRVMQSTTHYLGMPARRLLDGALRSRVDDALIDYSIGLEALLTEGVLAELRYRFALRGATILSWANGDREGWFGKLQDFYNVRSDIVHGRRVKQDKLGNSRSVGEDALRGIWWWYFNNNFAKLEDATSLVDSRIEGRVNRDRQW